MVMTTPASALATPASSKVRGCVPSRQRNTERMPVGRSTGTYARGAGSRHGIGEASENEVARTLVPLGFPRKVLAQPLRVSTLLRQEIPDPLMRVMPLTLKQANDLVDSLHRHHKPVRGHRFSIGCLDETGELVGAAIVGRPVARLTSAYEVAEVTRLVTNGHPNACSFLYGASARVAKEMGFLSIQTFILDSEPGTSLKAAGWECVGETDGGEGWQSRSGRRTDQPTVPKTKWRKVLNAR